MSFMEDIQWRPGEEESENKQEDSMSQNSTNTKKTKEEPSVEEEIANMPPEILAMYQKEAGLYLPYEQFQVARDLDDKQFKILICALDDYLRTGKIPDFNGDRYLILLFSWFKQYIDSSFNGFLKQRVKSKRGGAPTGNQNARKNPVNISQYNLKQPKTT